MTQEELKSVTITPEETKESGYFEFGVHEVKIRISIDTVRRILVHNQEDENIKQKIREKIQQIKNLADFAVLLEKTVGCTAWFKVSEDEDRTYEKDGKVKKSINRRIYGYKPKFESPKEQTEVKAETQEPETPENFDEPVDLSDIPF